jgi:hypothetical protein
MERLKNVTVELTKSEHEEFIRAAKKAKMFRADFARHALLAMVRQVNKKG